MRGGKTSFDRPGSGFAPKLLSIWTASQTISPCLSPGRRTTMIQLAWLWLRHQPTSALSVWFQERVQSNGGKMRKGFVTETVAGIKSAGKMAHDDLVCPPPVPPFDHPT